MISPIISRRAFLKSSTALAGGSVLCQPFIQAQTAAPKGPLMAYVGTYSSPLRKIPKGQVDLPAGNGRGIHLFRVDRATGALSPAGVFEQPASPSCLAINAAGTRMYATNETEKADEHDAGSVSAFAIERVRGELKLLNTVSSGGAGPTYLSVHPSGRFVLVANYFGGSVAVLPILQDGSLGAASDLKKGPAPLVPNRRRTRRPAASRSAATRCRTRI